MSIQHQGSLTVLFLCVHRLLLKLRCVSRVCEVICPWVLLSQAESFAAVAAVHRYRHGPSLLLHLGCMWMINSHQGPMVAERHTPASVCWAVCAGL